MNRHERRKQKKININNNSSQNELLKAIQFHFKKDFVNAETLYKKVITLDP